MHTSGRSLLDSGRDLPLRSRPSWVDAVWFGGGHRGQRQIRTRFGTDEILIWWTQLHSYKDTMMLIIWKNFWEKTWNSFYGWALTGRRASGMRHVRGLILQHRLGPLLFRFGLGFGQFLLLKYLLLFPSQIFLFDQLSPGFLLLFSHSVLFGFPSGIRKKSRWYREKLCV